ncbi:transcription factor Myb9, partial [Pavlovales sp. CCMP2436]
MPVLGRAIKQRWTTEEDHLLRDAVAVRGPHNWAAIASNVPNRNEKQCRERWMNQLRPDVDKGAWSPSEDARIVQLFGQLGSAWAEIAKHVPGRSDQMVKNRFNN